MTDVSYKEIWEPFLEWSNNETEIKLINDILSKISLFNSKEKPIQDCKYMLSNESEEFKCDLLWKKSKVAFFTADNDDYETAKKSNWHCFCGNDKDLNADDIINVIKES